MSEKKLTDKQKAFVAEYCSDFNATRAAEAAGYSNESARQIGSENLSKPYIREAINKRLSELAIGANEALKLMGDCVRANISDCIQIDPETGVFFVDLGKAEKAGVMPAIQEVSYDTNGRPKVKMYDRISALDKILRAHGAYVDRLRVDFNPTEMSDEQLEKIAAGKS